MRRLLLPLATVLLLVGVGLAPAAASGSDDSGRDSPSDRDDDDRREDDRDEDDRLDDDDDDDDDDDSHRRRRRRRRGSDDDRASGGGSGGTAAPGGPAAPQGTVTINDRSFSPQTIRVTVGGTVSWSNVSREHTVTAADRSFDSGVIDAGQRFRQTFAAPGTVDYLCLIHPEMTGRVIVGDGPAQSATGRASAASGSAGAAAGSGSAGGSGPPSLGSPAQAPVAAAQASTADVDVRDFEFAPSELVVPPGATVRWTLVGDAPHTVTSETFDSGMLNAGDTYEQTFTDEGTVDYRCELHPEMTAAVTVAANASPAGGGGGGGPPDDTATGTPAPTGDDAVPTAAGLANTGIRAGLAVGGALALIAAGWIAVTATRRRRVDAPPL